MKKSISLKKPKYQTGETVWKMKDNKPFSFEIGIIFYMNGFHYGGSPTYWNYSLRYCDDEILLFPSKEALIKSL